MNLTSELHLRAAVRVLGQGGVIACPTEAVWGLTCDPGNPDAVARLLDLKQRPVSKGLILVAADMSQLAPLLATLTEAQRSKLALSWPGPTTWLLPHNNCIPAWVHGEHDTIAVRVSAHNTVAALCRAWGGPLVSTSANPAGSRPATAAFQVRRYFQQQLDYIVPGAVGGATRPSVIRDLLTDRIIRS
ncbi:tRNA threonylcarbamoyladenosine biosynthesis protein RimN [Kineobactrum sediminis]|uniref:Threonylcarbamoyl-AMP synthase n=1 Tax=Kineobactrum sediminis TaxID=1905677 RepID=A0A2N5Y7X5_9GAMM|nr:Sua5/YciO/YrdC/YwlC family protein [Kineobactrum sediminis]PLW84479.1 tRNA threonylcarbamoyladenosine biosynthesis protein RimN [Kineobactrum sediminis]